MRRIAIFGPSGSGKSTLADKLGKMLSLPVHHLDRYYWTKSWKTRYSTKEEFNTFAASLLEHESWVIDGNYRATLDARLQKADTIIFLDVPKWKCYLRVFRRLFEKPFDKEEGMKNRVDWQLIQWIWQYDSDSFKQKALNHSLLKKVYVIKNRMDLHQLCSELSSN